MKKHAIVPDPDFATAGAAAPQVLVGAIFVAGVASRSQLPPPGPPEIAFAGRSNAGKSSAINVLAQRNRLAFASRTPGRTREINLFRLRSGALVADLPGYGYAAVSKDQKRAWQDLLWDYVTTRGTLVGLVLVADARHGLKELDLALLRQFVPSARPVLVLATKSDKLSQAERKQAITDMRGELAAMFPIEAAAIGVVAFSATRRMGLDAANATLAGWLGIG